jgi:hypothetical protein
MSSLHLCDKEIVAAFPRGASCRVVITSTLVDPKPHQVSGVSLYVNVVKQADVQNFTASEPLLENSPLLQNPGSLSKTLLDFCAEFIAYL